MLAIAKILKFSLQRMKRFDQYSSINFFYRQSNPVPNIPNNLDSRTTITIENENFEIAADDLEVQCILGRGAYGVVEKVKHKPTGTILAVKRITATTNSIETKRLLMDLDISMRSMECPYTVHYFGAMFREGDVMICMEVMDISLDKFYARAFNINKPIPEDVLGKVAYSVSTESTNSTIKYSTTDFFIHT